MLGFVMRPAGSKKARARFRRAREGAGFSQIGLSRTLERSTAYVAHIENGYLNPSLEERAKLAGLLGVDEGHLFAGFPKPKAERDAELGARIVEEYDGGAADAVIAQLVGLSPSAVRTRRLLAGRASRPNLRTFKTPAGHLTAKAAAEKYRLDLGRLCEAIDAGIVPGQHHDVAASHPVHTVVETPLEKYLANRPQCAYEGCGRRAALASDACGGPHARALETKGTKLSGETSRKMSAGKKGKPRPDVRARVAAMHEDKEQHYRWDLALVKGRARISTPEAAAKMERRAKLRLNRTLGARGSDETGRPTVERKLAESEEGRAKLAAFRRYRERHPEWGRPTLVAHTGLSDSQIRALLD
jgi:transcriptional regulator with XRE-family HTH domain